MARYNTVLSSATTTTTATISAPGQGLFTEFTGTAPYTVTIPDPTVYTGQTQSFYNSTSGVITIQTPVGGEYFKGPGLSGSTTTFALPSGSTVVIASDGASYIVLATSGGPVTTSSLAINNAGANTTLSPANYNVVISPSGTGLVTISPATKGTLDNIDIGVTTAQAGNFTTIGATTPGTAVFKSFSISGAAANTTISPANYNVVISPTGTGVVTISPATAGSMDNVTIGGSTPQTGSFINVNLNTSGILTHNNTLQGASATSGQSALFKGGVGIAGTLYTVGLVETSSIAFKENISPITNALDAVLKLTGVTYDRKDNKKHEAGLIAEHVFKVAPELVALDEKGKPYGIHYTKVSAYLIECIKTLQDEINELKGKPTAKTKAKGTK